MLKLVIIGTLGIILLPLYLSCWCIGLIARLLWDGIEEGWEYP